MCQHRRVKARPYHHGDLRQALLDRGALLLREQGPTALSAREATREIGVSVTALYRHFTSVEQWRAEVSRCARQSLAQSMIDAIARTPAVRPAALAARRRFRATGRGYVRFALTEPLLFQGAFMPCADEPALQDDPSAWQVLEEALDDLVATGAMPAARRPEAPIIAWSAAHGLAALIVQGGVSVSGLDDPQVTSVFDGVSRALGIAND